MASTLLPALDAYDVDFKQVPHGEEVISDAEDDDPSTIPVIASGDVEKMELLLPSTYAGVLPIMLHPARHIELQLRQAQAEEALEEIRRKCHNTPKVFGIERRTYSAPKINLFTQCKRFLQ
jgi:hypothetical protein